jgi:hypothetical protein
MVKLNGVWTLLLCALFSHLASGLLVRRSISSSSGAVVTIALWERRRVTLLFD